MKRLLDVIAFLIGKAALGFLNLIGKNGYHHPGELAYHISHSVLDYIDKPKSVVFITGTNGKSTTTMLVKHILLTAGKKVAFNTESNTQPGILSALLRYTSITNHSKADILVLEVAEEAIQKIVKVIKPNYVLITNVQNDTFQVNLSPNYITDKVKSILSDEMSIFVNNENPAVLSYKNQFSNAITFSVAKNKFSTQPVESLFTVTSACPICNSKLVFEYYNISSIGKFHCSNCDFSSLEKTDYVASNFDIEKETITINEETYPMHYTAPHFAYNYVLAYALAKEMNISNEMISKAFDNFVNIDGRFEEERIGDTTLRYMRYKQETPDTLQSSLDQIYLDTEQKSVILSLDLVDNDSWGPPFAETFYSYDCDFEKLADTNVDKYICTGAVVAFDAANRLIYAGIPKEKIVIINSDDPFELLKYIKEASPKLVYMMTYLGHYRKIRRAIIDEQ